LSGFTDRKSHAITRSKFMRPVPERKAVTSDRWTGPINWGIAGTRTPTWLSEQERRVMAVDTFGAQFTFDPLLL